MNLSKTQVLQTLEQSVNSVELQGLREVGSEFETFNVVLGKLIEEKTHYVQDDFYRSRLQLERNFCPERLKQAIDIKLNLVAIGAKGFTKSDHVETVQNVIANDVSGTPDHHVNNVEQNATLDDFASTFADELSNHDLHGLKVSLLNLLLDHSKPVSKLNKLLSLMQSKYPDVFEEYKEDHFNKPMSEDVNVWTSDYFFKQNLSLETNFAFERYEHLLEVREHLRVNGAPDFQFIEPTKRESSFSQSQEQHKTEDGFECQHQTNNNQKSWVDELIDILIDSLQKIKDVSFDLIEKVKSKLK